MKVSSRSDQKGNPSLSTSARGAAAALLLAGALFLSSCASSPLFTERGRDNYFGGHGQGGSQGSYIPREVQRTESVVPMFPRVYQYQADYQASR